MKIKRYKIRLIILLVLMTGGMLFLVKRLHELQVLETKRWDEFVPGEKIETIRLPAVRGNIIDRYGEVLATNKMNYELDINLEEMKNFYNDGFDTPLNIEKLTRREDGMRTIRKETDIAKITEAIIKPKLKEFGISKKVTKSSLRTHYSTHKGLIGYNFSDNLEYEQFCVLSENLDSIPGAEVSVRPRRIYPYGALAGHILGNTKLWKNGDIPEHEKNKFTHYKGDIYGDIGIELTMNDYLRGEPGKRTISRGPKGVFLGRKAEDPPQVGATVQLTIDAGLQSYVEGLLRNVGRAGVSVINVKTGEVLALASVPSINPNDYIPRISQKKYDYYNLNKAAPFLNNAIQQHQPGSVFKLPVALAAAQRGYLGYSHNCIGHSSFGRDDSLKIRCWNTSGHGVLNMTSSIQRSCNPYFMTLANQIGGKQVVDTFTLLGYGQKTGISVTNEESGVVPGSLKWKRNVAPGEPFTPATLAQLSIGQADSSATTLQVAASTAAIANGGRFMKPRIIKSVQSTDGTTLIEDTPSLRVNLLQEGISEGDLQIIKKGMWRAVNESGGTAKTVQFSESIEAAAKTGTAQTVEFGRKSNNAWTTAFAPYDDPEYAICAVVLGGKSGGAVAGPIVRETFKALFSEEEILPQVMENYAGNINEIEKLELPPVTEENLEEENLIQTTEND